MKAADDVAKLHSTLEKMSAALAERDQKRAAKRSLRERFVAAYRALLGSLRKTKVGAEAHYEMHPLDAPHPVHVGIQMIRVRLDDASKDLPVAKRPVLGGPERVYAHVKAGHGQGARVRRLKSNLERARLQLQRAE